MKDEKEKFEVLEDGYVHLTAREYLERYEDLWVMNWDGEMVMLPVRFEEE